MVSPAYLSLLIDFHYWARDRVLGASEALTPGQYTRDLGNSFNSIRDTLVHLYSAEWVWYERWHGRVPTAHIPAERYPDVASLRRDWSEHEPKVRTFVASQDAASVDRIYDYRLFNGAAGRSPLWQMVTHLVNHGTYHRGQITTMLRQLGAEPANGLDLIGYYREKRPEGV